MFTEYRVTVHPKDGTAYNPLHDELQGAIATNVHFDVGERGYFLAKCPDGEYSISTSMVEQVDCFENGNICLTTRNTIYLFHKIT